MRNRVSCPIFFIGMPRSGTTIVFEAFARHPHLAWLSNYSQSYPYWPSLNAIRCLHDNSLITIEAKKKQYAKVTPGNRFFVKPAEAYQFWDFYSGIDFSFDSLSGQRAEPDTSSRVNKAVSEIICYQGRKRFATKLTGPPRITYLASIFPDAKFVHVIRDGRAVTHSLLKVPFWKEKGGFDGPFWKGLPEEYLRIWKEDKDPGVITALQWKGVIEQMEKESKDIKKTQFVEVRYEDFVSDPHGWINRLYGFCGLADSDRPHKYIDASKKLENMNFKYREEWPHEYIEKLGNLMEPFISRYGYATSQQVTS